MPEMPHPREHHRQTGIVDVQTATLDDPAAFPPQANIQAAERISWMKEAHTLPEFERFPGG